MTLITQVGLHNHSTCTLLSCNLAMWQANHCLGLALNLAHAERRILIVFTKQQAPKTLLSCMGHYGMYVILTGQHSIAFKVPAHSQHILDMGGLLPCTV